MCRVLFALVVWWWLVLLNLARSACLVSVARLRGILIHEARILQHVGPLAAGTGMAVLEMLTEVVGAVKLLGRVAFSKLVHLLEVANTLVPVLVGRTFGEDSAAEGASARDQAATGKLVAAVAADVSLARSVR